MLIMLSVQILMLKYCMMERDIQSEDRAYPVVVDPWIKVISNSNVSDSYVSSSVFMSNESATQLYLAILKIHKEISLDYLIILVLKWYHMNMKLGVKY